MGLTLDEANRILRGALAKAQELNIKISASVCDAGGRAVAFQRMDNAIWASAYASAGKAVASAAFGRPRREMGARADQPTPRGVTAAEGGHMIMGRERFRSYAMASLRAPAALAAAPPSRTKTAPAPASPSCSSPLRFSGQLQDAVVKGVRRRDLGQTRTWRLAFSDDEVRAENDLRWSRYSIRADSNA
jgi:glc operon protein GlcG